MTIGKNFQSPPVRAALYMRLSKDDGEVRESSSITNQRKLLRSYAALKGFPVCGEYADDGFSFPLGNRFSAPEETPKRVRAHGRAAPSFPTLTATTPSESHLKGE